MFSVCKTTALAFQGAVRALCRRRSRSCASEFLSRPKSGAGCLLIATSREGHAESSLHTQDVSKNLVSPSQGGSGTRLATMTGSRNGLPKGERTFPKGAESILSHSRRVPRTSPEKDVCVLSASFSTAAGEEASPPFIPPPTPLPAAPALTFPWLPRCPFTSGAGALTLRHPQSDHHSFQLTFLTGPRLLGPSLGAVLEGTVDGCRAKDEATGNRL